jgi:hypothetical protein
MTTLKKSVKRKRVKKNGSKKSLKIQNKTLKKNKLKKNKLKGGVFSLAISLRTLYYRYENMTEEEKNITEEEKKERSQELREVGRDIVKLLKIYNDFGPGYEGNFYPYVTWNRDIRIGVDKKIEDKTKSVLVRLNPNPFSTNSSYYLERTVIRKFFYRILKKDNEEYSFKKFFKLASNIIAPELFQKQNVDIEVDIEVDNLLEELNKYTDEIIKELLNIDFLNDEFSRLLNLMVGEKQEVINLDSNNQLSREHLKNNFKEYIVGPLEEEMKFIRDNIRNLQDLCMKIN